MNAFKVIGTSISIVFWEIDLEYRESIAGLGKDLSAMGLDDRACDGKPEASTITESTSRVIHSIEPIKDPSQVFRRNLSSRVFDTNVCNVVDVGQRNLDRPVDRRVSDGIRQ